MSEGKNERDAASELARILKSLDQRLTSIEQQMQPGHASPVIRSSKEPSHTLEATEKVMTGGGLQTNTTVPVCAVCHQVISGEYSVCHHCNQVVCASCVVVHNNMAHCEHCLRKEHLDLSKRDYLTLICIANGITDPDAIAELTLLRPDQAKRSMSKLSSLNLTTVEKALFGLSWDIKLTDEGGIAVNVYRRVYGRHEDVAEFGRRLREYLAETS
jgi:hypothetical protein